MAVGFHHRRCHHVRSVSVDYGGGNNRLGKGERSCVYGRGSVGYGWGMQEAGVGGGSSNSQNGGKNNLKL
jgi:hypothetical protein